MNVATKEEKRSVVCGEGVSGKMSVSLKCRTVTASSQEELEKGRQVLASLDPRVSKMAEEFHQVFQAPDATPPQRSVMHTIRLYPHTVPIRRAPYPIGEEKRKTMVEQVAELAERGWVSPSESPWGAPVLFVKKKEGTWRLCIDFRDLNAVTIDDSFPLPRVEVLLHRAGAASVFSKLDLASGFHQIALSIPSRALTAFRLPEPVKGCTHWEWTVMPFGLKNAPPTFQRAMTAALQGCEDFCVVYIDDILVFSKNEEEHLEHLRQVMGKLREHAYHVRLAKCEFLRSEVEFLGHKLSAMGLATAEEKVKALNSWQAPLKSAKQVRQFLGLALWYRSFIPHLATIAMPLFKLTSGRTTFCWTDAATQAMDTLKKLVSSAPCLARWEHERETRVVTDASKVGVGAVLEQEHGTGWRPVAFWSRGLRDAETRYSTTDREWLAVVEAVSRRWRGFLEDRPFSIHSDHAALERKLCKSGHDPPVTDRQSRWIEALLPFPFTFKYIKGADNTVADALSRCPLVANTVTLVRSLWTGLVALMRVAANADEDYKRLKEEVDKNPEGRKIVNGLVCDEHNRWIVPDNCGVRTFLLAEAHDSPLGGHFGEEKTMARLREQWKWKGDVKDVREYVATCVRCQKTKASNRKTPGLLHPILAGSPGEVLTLDFVSKFAPAKRTKHQQCVVAIDKFSRFTFLKGCSLSITAKETAAFLLERVFPVLGIPKKVISDRGPQFTAVLWKEFLKALGAKGALAAAHHPQSDGLSERTVRTFIHLLRSYTVEVQDRWEEMLPLFEFAINSSVCSSTGYSPYVALFGRQPKTPVGLAFEEDALPESNEVSQTPSTDVWVRKLKDDLHKIHDIIRRHQQKKADASKAWYDERRRPLLLQPGDLVLLSVRSHVPIDEVIKKQSDRYQGPYVVDCKIHDNAYRLRGLPPHLPKTQNVEFLRLFKPSPARFEGRPGFEVALPVMVEGSVEWEVEAVLGCRRTRTGKRYLVKWKDSPLTQWLREEQLEHCQDLIQEYHAANATSEEEGSSSNVEEPSTDLAASSDASAGGRV